MILVPTYLIVHYLIEPQFQNFDIGVLLYIVFAALATSKIYDDLKRLSIINKGVEVQEQQFKNFGLSTREQEVANLLVKGISYKNIAEQLFISLPTVKSHASNIYRKCQVKTRNELTYLLSK